MLYKTHLVTSLVTAMPIMVAIDSVSVATISAVALGSLFPDIDEPGSWVGSRTRGVSDLFKVIFGHRGLTHSLVGVVAIAFFTSIIAAFTPLTWDVGLFFILGYVLHLVGDSFSKSGVKWLQPFSNKNIQFGFKKIYYRTGSLVEWVIFFFFLGIAIWQFPRLNIGQILARDIHIALRIAVDFVTGFF